MAGKLYGLGVGPGDPELITLKALRVLQQVPVVAVPVSRHGEDSLALTVAKSHLRPEQEIITLQMPMSRDQECLEKAWEAAAGRLLEKLGKGLDVAFLTLGDASLYSSYSYLMEKVGELESGVEIETVPGVTSFAAAAARLNQPLAKGDEPLAVVPLLEDPEVLGELLPHFSNMVLMKVARRYDEIVRVLKENGRAENAVLISRCGLDGEIVSRDLDEGIGKKHDYLTAIIVKGAESK
ncbi:precorrin-2 C(20)-methyltransferase [Pelotomaculum isophthalicicum JI]|uniref:Precorrin-2 C(20)-methyltransferase n=1 Tax=Pelotomaculum isophthalicicum JI TaxID=947010 RepID=A0A9X4JUB2_9FIRM|nr:precorrin-2 C(20)-methyltransferase [Pelotomaculum isophthalicicum]MDF9408845.1 precorrin-2 C(20)-methyltransferase [Pelotomaculum isophthalicicum JI]